MALSIFSKPLICLCLPQLTSERCKCLCSAGAKVPEIKEDFPEPLTPVIAVNAPNGNFTSISFKLLCLAPLISKNCPRFAFFLTSGVGIVFLPAKYAPVIDSSSIITSEGGPFATTRPPCIPAPGPKSHNQSACLKVSSSCSTTSNVLPKSLNSRNVFNRRSLSL